MFDKNKKKKENAAAITLISNMLSGLPLPEWRKNNIVELELINKRCEEKEQILNELGRLRNDHWDKYAFDRLAKKILNL